MSMDVELLPHATVDKVGPVVLDGLQTAQRTMYNVRGLSPVDQQDHITTLTITPNTRERKRGPRRGRSPRCESFSCAKIVQGGLVVPRFYGIAHFGNAQNDVTHQGDECAIGFKGTLFQYQVEAVDTCLTVMRRIGGTIMCAGCGTGKTIMALAIASRLRVRLAVLVHKDSLAQQWAERVRSFTEASVTIVQGAGEWDREADVIIVMIQTVLSRYCANDFDGVGLLVVDEAHHIAAKCFSQAMMCFGARYRLGLTATPDRRDGLGMALNWHLGPTATHIRRRQSVSVMWIKGDMTLSAATDKNGDFSYANTVKRLIESDVRNQIIQDTITTLIDAGRSVLVIGERRAHLTYLSNYDYGNVSPCLYMGETSVKKKRSRDQSAVHGNPIFASYSMAEEGVDIPRLDSIVFATPRGAPSSVEQAIGRILREFPGKHTPLVVDIKDSVFSSMARERTKLYRKCAFIEKDVGVLSL